MLDDWPGRGKWTLDWLAAQFGEREVEVQFGRNADADYEMNSIAHKRHMPFGEYVERVRSSASTNDFYMTANNDSRNRQALDELWQDMPLLPEYLNGERKGFFWLGPAGTITPFHHDLTNNFMIQVMGRKRVRLIAPCETPRLQNQRHCFTPSMAATSTCSASLRWPACQCWTLNWRLAKSCSCQWAGGTSSRGSTSH